MGCGLPPRAAITDDNGRLIDERLDPRGHFGGVVQQVYWDKLDILTFAGYALWNYLSFPFLLEGKAVELTGAEGPSESGVLRLDACFPSGAPTHSERQSFFIDAERRLVRHDYTAEPIGSWATGANLCLGSEIVAGLRFYTRRKVFPRLGPQKSVVRYPTLVWIELDDVSVVPADPARG